MFSCVWLHFKIFFEKYFLVFGKEAGKEEGRGKTQKNPDKPRKTRHDLAIDGAISRSMERSQIAIDSAISDRNQRRNLAKHRSRSTRTVLREIAISDRDRQCDLAIGALRDCAVGSRLSVSRSTIRIDRDLMNCALPEIALRNLAFFLSLVLPLRVPSFGNHLK